LFPNEFDVNRKCTNSNKKLNDHSTQYHSQLFSSGDGNCLVHAVSMAVWGIEDSTCFLRRLLYMALVYDEDTKQFQKRWQHERQSQNEQFPGGGLDMSPQVLQKTIA